MCCDVDDVVCVYCDGVEDEDVFRGGWVGVDVCVFFL